MEQVGEGRKPVRDSIESGPPGWFSTYGYLVTPVQSAMGGTDTTKKGAFSPVFSRVFGARFGFRARRRPGQCECLVTLALLAMSEQIAPFCCMGIQLFSGSRCWVIPRPGGSAWGFCAWAGGHLVTPVQSRVGRTLTPQMGLEFVGLAQGR